MFNSKRRRLDWIEDDTGNMDCWSWHAEHAGDDGRGYVCGIDIFFGGQQGRAAVCERTDGGWDGGGDIVEFDGQQGRVIAEIETGYDDTYFDSMAEWCERQLGL